jgi:hypothetical protein
MTKVDPEVIECGNAAAIAAPFLGLIEAAQLHHGVAPRGVGRHARAHVVVHVHLDVSAQLLAQILIAMCVQHRVPETNQKRS